MLGCWVQGGECCIKETSRKPPMKTSGMCTILQNSIRNNSLVLGREWGNGLWGLYRDYYRDPFPHSLLSTIGRRVSSETRDFRGPATQKEGAVGRSALPSLLWPKPTFARSPYILHSLGPKKTLCFLVYPSFRVFSMQRRL